MPTIRAEWERGPCPRTERLGCMFCSLLMYDPLFRVRSDKKDVIDSIQDTLGRSRKIVSENLLRIRR